MKNFPRVQKKGILSTRAIENSRMHNSNENFDQMVEKQLEDDFKVHEYLNQNPNEGHNSQQYTALLDSLLVKKMCKVKRKELLKSTKTQFQSTFKSDEYSQRSCSKSIVKGQAEDAYYSEEEYLAIKQQSEAQQEIIEAKTEQELEMKRVLMKQITENKKSLNLLKGDIGHMITRNESISVLQSKVNKVSLVSENQLKRVSLALTKDKEEVLLRQQMQKKFSLKLKTIQCIENKNLKKIKGSYLESMNRRRQIFQNLHQIQKQCASIQEYSDKQKQKEEKNAKTLESFRLLKFACMVILQSNQLWQLFSSKQLSSYQFSQKLNSMFNLNVRLEQKSVFDNLIFHIDQVTEDELSNLCKHILAEYWRLTVQIQEKKKIYNQYLETIQQYWLKLGLCYHKQESILSEFNIEHRNELAITSADEFSFASYFTMFGKLSRNYRILYSLINFMNKKVSNFTDRVYVTQIYKNECFHVKIRDNSEEYKDFNQLLFNELQMKIKSWFQILIAQIRFYDKIPEQAKEQIKNLLTSTQFSNGKQNDNKEDYNDEMMYNQFQDNISSTSNSERQKVNELNTEKQSTGETKSSSRILSRFNNQNSTAKRIQTLQKIDQSYYKMIKQTIEMEKENTMKNYQFQKSFKRNKYSSQDQLLQEKRFEATFSNLFKQDPDEGSKFKSKQDSMKISRVLNKESSFGKTAFESLHIRNKPTITSKSSTFHLAKKNATFWQNQNKVRLRRKLESVLTSI